MEVYIFQSALLCQDCGEALKVSLIKEGKIPSGKLDCHHCGEIFPYTKDLEISGQGRVRCPNCNEFEGDWDNFDSDNFPAGPYPDGGGESDSPQHCDRHDKCLNALKFDDKKCGAFLENPLTSEGEKNLIEMCSESYSEYQVRLHKFWKRFYQRGRK